MWSRSRLREEQMMEYTQLESVLRVRSSHPADLPLACRSWRILRVSRTRNGPRAVRRAPVSGGAPRIELVRLEA